MSLSQTHNHTHTHTNSLTHTLNHTHTHTHTLSRPLSFSRTLRVWAVEENTREHLELLVNLNKQVDRITALDYTNSFVRRLRVVGGVV
jgi:hypothetical protein